MSATNQAQHASLQPITRTGCCLIRPHEQLINERQRLKERLRNQKIKCHRLTERLNAMEASLSWKIVRRLSRLRTAVAPDNSWRLAGLRLALRGLRRWRQGGTRAFSRQVISTLLRHFAWQKRGRIEESAFSSQQDSKTTAPPSEQRGRRGSPNRTWGATVPSERKYRVLFIGSLKREMLSMRYRAHNVMEALALAGLEADFVEEEEVAEHSARILSHDLIVLTRVKYGSAIASLIDDARRLGIPVVFDIDDLVFEPWVLPYVEAFRVVRRADVLQYMDQMSKCLDNSDYFTGSTPYLLETAAARGKHTFLLRNGLNAAQMEASRLALERRQARVRDGTVRIGYFSGTRSHQADFRTVYPALMALLREESKARLVITGNFDLDEFPGLTAFTNQIEHLPLRDWRGLPATIAQVDVNLIPLELNPFNEGKSNLKYYEAGILKIPSIASPTGILRESITHGYNGLLARATDEWYAGLKNLITHADYRQQLGQHAYEHVLRNYTPREVSIEAANAYRQIIRMHRLRRGIAEDALNIVVLVRSMKGDSDDSKLGLLRANELAAAGHAVTLLFASAGRYRSAEALRRFVTRRYSEPHFAIQAGGDIPCCDVLIYTDHELARVARENAHRAHLLFCGALHKDGEPPMEDHSLLAAFHRSAKDLELLLRTRLEDGVPTCQHSLLNRELESWAA